MTKSVESRWVLVLAAGTVSLGLLQTQGWAQYQTENNTGRALDANNRLGSDGTNPSRQADGVTANDLVYGTVTRGKQIRAGQELAPTQFRGNLIRPSDTLVRDAGVSVYDRGANYDPSQSSRYWGDARGVSAPTGFQQVQIGSPGQFPVTPSPFRVPGDLRMDAAIPNPDMGLSRPSQYILPGISPTTGSEVVFAPPPDVPSLAQQQQATLPLMPSSELLRRLDLNETKIKEMQEEVRRTSSGDEVNASQDVTQAPETPTNDAMKSDMENALQAQAVSGSLYTDQALRQRLVTAAPVAARQNTQYAALQQRLQRFRQSQTMTDQQANQQFLEDWRKAQEEQKKQQGEGKPPAPRPEDIMRERNQQAEAAKKDQAGKPGAEAVTADRRARELARTQLEPGQRAKVEGLLPPQPDIPVRISSFADGVKATGLKALLIDAEKAMQAGKFTQALDYYDAATAVAPDNSMVLMGRAVAELGAGYYARAQINLEQVLSADPALLMARYDLKTFYGEDRLQYVVRDLKDLAQTESRQARPLFLLAYIAYNTENEQRAGDYLNLAQQRGGSKEFYDELREYWRLNTEGPKKPVLKDLKPR